MSSLYLSKEYTLVFRCVTSGFILSLLCLAPFMVGAQPLRQEVELTKHQEAQEQQRPDINTGTNLDVLTVEMEADFLRVVPAGDHKNPEDLDASSRSDTGDALRELVGVSGSRIGGHGVDLFIRGQKATQVNVLLDGAFIYGACPNRMDPPISFAEMLSYDEMTIIKGVQSMQYGAGGSGGTVLLHRRTQDAPQGTHGTIAFKGTDNGLRAALSFNLTQVSKRNWFRTWGSYKNAGNYTDGGGRRWATAYRSHQWGLLTGFRPVENQSMEFRYEHNTVLDALFPGAGMDSPQDDASTGSFSYQIDPVSPRVKKIRVEAYRSQVDHLMDNYSLRENTGMTMASPAHSDTDGIRLLAESDSHNNKWILSYGAEYKKTARKASLGNPMMGATLAWTWPGVETEITSGFFDARHLLSESSRVLVGVRLDHVSAGAALLHIAPSGAPMNTPSAIYRRVYGENGASRDETNVGGLLRYEQTLASGLFWFVDVNRIVRTADATERYFAKPDWVGNPAILPEKHSQFDAGFSLTYLRTKLNANVFYDDVSDYILRDRNNTTTIYRNIEAALYGGEVIAETSLENGWKVDAAVSWTFGKNRTDRRYLPQIPAHEGMLQVYRQRQSTKLGARLNFAARQSRVDVHSGLDIAPTPGWATVNIFAEKKIGQHWQLNIGVDNLFGREYAQHLNRKDAFGNVALVNEPGRTTWLRALCRF